MSGVFVCMCVCLVRSDSATPWTIACQAPLSMGFSRQPYWSGLPFPTPGDLLNQRIEQKSCISSIGRQILYHCITWEAPRAKVMGVNTWGLWESALTVTKCRLWSRHCAEWYHDTHGSTVFLKYIYLINLYIWLHQVFVVARGIFIVSFRVFQLQPMLLQFWHMGLVVLQHVGS